MSPHKPLSFGTQPRSAYCTTPPQWRDVPHTSAPPAPNVHAPHAFAWRQFCRPCLYRPFRVCLLCRTFSLGRLHGWQLLTNELSSFYYTWEAEKVSESLVVQWRFMKFWATATAFICKGPGFRKANASDCRTVAAHPPQ